MMRHTHCKGGSLILARSLAGINIAINVRDQTLRGGRRGGTFRGARAQGAFRAQLAVRCARGNREQLPPASRPQQ